MSYSEHGVGLNDAERERLDRCEEPYQIGEITQEASEIVSEADVDLETIK